MIAFFLFLVCPAVLGLKVLDQKHWKETALEELKSCLSVKENTNKAKNLILFIGDGMGPNTVTAARLYNGGETSYLSWEQFPHLGAAKTYCVSNQVPDSASSGTALFTGVKVNLGTLGVDSTVQRRDCNASILEKNRLVSIATKAQAAGKATGFVTTTRVTHATPGALYAHSADRKWECDSSLPPEATLCKDIGRQLVEDSPGNRFNVIMGGGRQILKAASGNYSWDPIENSDSCVRTDGRDLIAEWAAAKKKAGLRYKVVNDTVSLRNVAHSDTDYLLGIFFNDHLPYEHVRDKSEKGVPSLEEMTTAAVKVLMKNKNGFMLMVEGGMIDHAHHDGKVRKALDEVVQFSKAINVTMELLKSAGLLEETLVIVTSDHSHALSISGFAPTGGDVLGMGGEDLNGIPYTVLSYAIGKDKAFHYRTEDGKIVREDPSLVDTRSYGYRHQVAVVKEQNYHGGSDVFVYASGPYSHLFRHMHEQHYIHTVMTYAARIGEFTSAEHGAAPSSSSTSLVSSMLLVAVVQIFQAISL